MRIGLIIFLIHLFGQSSHAKFSSAKEINSSHFVKRISQCTKKLGRFDENACSLAVRKISECAGLGTGWCSGSAADYDRCPYSCAKSKFADCNQLFRKNWQARSTSSKKCMAPGSIRVYRGLCHRYKYFKGELSQSETKQRNQKCLKKLKSTGFLSSNAGIDQILSGDFHGHIEIVGQNAKIFHHFEDKPTPINSSQELGSRRIFTKCLTPKFKK